MRHKRITASKLLAVHVYSAPASGAWRSASQSTAISFVAAKVAGKQPVPYLTATSKQLLQLQVHMLMLPVLLLLGIPI